MKVSISEKKRTGPAVGTTLRAPSFLSYRDVAAALGSMRDQTATAGSLGVRMGRSADFVSRALLNMVDHGSIAIDGPNRYRLTGKLAADGGIQPRCTRGRPL